MSCSAYLMFTVKLGVLAAAAAVPTVVLRNGVEMPLVAAGVEPSIDTATLDTAGARPLRGGDLIAKPATLVDLVTPDAQTEYWLGFRNFYAITRYNRSYFYAMAVYQLSQELRQG